MNLIKFQCFFSNKTINVASLIMFMCTYIYTLICIHFKLWNQNISDYIKLDAKDRWLVYMILMKVTCQIVHLQPQE